MELERQLDSVMGAAAMKLAEAWRGEGDFEAALEKWETLTVQWLQTVDLVSLLRERVDIIGIALGNGKAH